MSTYISLYCGNPTAGGTDGTLISENMAQTSPLSVTLNATENEVKAMKVAIRCENGYRTTGNVVIGFKFWDGSAYQETGGNISKWKLAADNSYTKDNVLESAAWGDSLTISDVIRSTNHCFWVRAESSSDEKPQTDKSVAIHVEGIVEADE